jgi:hypothetical protein
MTVGLPNCDEAGRLLLKLRNSEQEWLKALERATLFRALQE